MTSADSTLVETPHFRVLGACVEPRRRLHLDNDLGDAIVAELAPLGLVPDLDAFERIFVRTVEGSAPTPGLAWSSFYRNTLARLRRPAEAPSPDGSVATFARIYAEAAAAATGPRVLDVGCCFGFASMLLAEQRPDVLALGSDLSAESVALAARMGRGLRSRARFVTADAARLPFPDRSFSSVTALHLLEHLPPAIGRRVLTEALRVADRRVVVAVPLETEPQPAYGHVRTYSLATLREVGAATGWDSVVWESDGGWLRLDRPAGWGSADGHRWSG